MTYPQSSDVTDGMPTSYLHYNTLRADALFLGNLPADSVSLGAALARYADNLVCVPLATDRLRIPYDPLAPCVLMVDGVLCKAAADIDTTAGLFTGLAATWYIFANRAAGSTTFTLSANTTVTEAAGQRRIAMINWDGTHLVYPTLYVLNQGRPGAYYGRVNRIAAQTINAATLTAINFDTQESDPDGMWAIATPNKLTIVHPGIYFIHAQVAGAAAPTQYFYITLRLNGVTLLSTGQVLNPLMTAQTTLVRHFWATDYVEVMIYQQGGATLNTASPTFLTAIALSA